MTTKHRFNFVAYEASNSDYEWFETLEQAVAWLREANSEGISEETIEGLSFIAHITHRTGFIETDRQKNYHEHTEECPSDCEEEEWPYSSDWELVGKMIFVSTVPLTQEATP